MSLSHGSLGAIQRGETPPRPFVRVTSLTAIQKPDKGTRYKLMFTDGQTTTVGLLTPALHHMVENKQLKQHTTVQLLDYLPEVQGQQKFILVVSLKVVAQGFGNQNMNPNVKPEVSRNLPVKRNTTDTGETPVAAINPYKTRWTLRCRVTKRSDIRTWDKGPTNQGKLFSVDLMDREGNDIRATFFRDAVDTFYPMLEEGKVFTFSNGQVKLANKRFNNTKSDYEITFNANAQINEVFGGDDIKKVQLSPVKLGSITPEKVDCLLDLICVVVSTGVVENFTSKAGKEYTKLDVVLADDSNVKVSMTVFGDKAHEYHDKLTMVSNQVVGVKGAKVSTFNGLSLTLFSSGGLHFDLDIPEFMQMQRWASSGVDLDSMTSLTQSNQGDRPGFKGVFVSVAERKLVQEINNVPDLEATGQDLDKGAYIVMKGAITFFRKQTVWYPSCPEEGNNKKVILQPDMTYFCEATGKSYETCQWRYILNAKISDATSSCWATIFDEAAANLIGHAADELHELREASEETFEAILNKALFQECLWKLRIKKELYNGEERLRYSVVEYSQINHDTEGRQLIEYISQF